MSFIFMVFHYPTPEHRDELLHGMVEMAGFFADKPGFIDAGPWVEEGEGRIVGISRWESKEAFLASGLTIGDSTEIPEGELDPGSGSTWRSRPLRLPREPANGTRQPAFKPVHSAAADNFQPDEIR